MEYQAPTIEQQPGLADELNAYTRYVQASVGQRFLNYLIDNLFMRFGLSYVTGTALGYLLGTLSPDYASKIIYDKTSFDVLLLAYMLGILNYLTYYTFCEKVFKGYTLGKLITGTRAVGEDGNELKFKQAFLRSLARLVPFEPLSAFAQRPWHDSWTKTTVVKAR